MIRNEYTGGCVPTLRSVHEVLRDISVESISRDTYEWGMRSVHFIGGFRIATEYHDPEAWEASDFHIADNDLEGAWNGTCVHATCHIIPRSARCEERTFDIWLYDNGEQMNIEFDIRPEWYNDVEFVVRRIRERLYLFDMYPDISMNNDDAGNIVMEFREGLYTTERNVRYLDSWAVRRHSHATSDTWTADLSQIVYEFKTK